MNRRNGREVQAFDIGEVEVAHVLQFCCGLRVVLHQRWEIHDWKKLRVLSPRGLDLTYYQRRVKLPDSFLKSLFLGPDKQQVGLLLDRVDIGFGKLSLFVLFCGCGFL